MSDQEIRALERALEAGDPTARRRLRLLRVRRRLCAGCGAPLPETAACCCFRCWAPAANGRCEDCPREETP